MGSFDPSWLTEYYAMFFVIYKRKNIYKALLARKIKFVGKILFISKECYISLINKQD